jgi:hypothetical protein
VRLLLTILALLSGVATAADYTSFSLADCESPESRTRLYADIRSLIADLGNAVEELPPGEKAYIERETRQALGRREPPERMRLVMERPYYRAYKLRSTIDRLLAVLKASEERATDSSREAFGWARLVNELADTRLELDEYRKVDAGKAAPVLGQDKYDRFLFYLTSKRVLALYATRCALGLSKSYAVP